MNVLKSRNIGTDKVVRLGTDGASVMTVKDKGVFGRLKALNPHLINIHCLAHRLALCTSQAASGMTHLKNYKEWMCNLFYYFKRSPKREKQLHRVQSLLDQLNFKYREIHSVRWMSFYEALQAVYRTLDPLLTYFYSRERQKDPTERQKDPTEVSNSQGFIDVYGYYTVHIYYTCDEGHYSDSF